MRAFFLAVPAVLLMTFTARAAEDSEPSLPAVPREAAPAASKALATFSKLVTAENYEQMGFGSPEEVKTATLGVPAMEFFVQLDSLQNYQNGQPPADLLSGGARVVYPVLVKDTPRSSLELVKRKEEWRAASFGDASFIRQLSQVREEKAKELQISLSAFSIVWVPALHLYFLCHEQSGELMLTPINDDERFGFVTGKSLPATQVFLTIQPTAKATPDLPG
jgi:hypothetical protein